MTTPLNPRSALLSALVKGISYDEIVLSGGRTEASVWSSVVRSSGLSVIEAASAGDCQYVVYVHYDMKSAAWVVEAGYCNAAVRRS